jgi:hypothetical protein
VLYAERGRIRSLLGAPHTTLESITIHLYLPKPQIDSSQLTEGASFTTVNGKAVTFSGGAIGGANIKKKDFKVGIELSSMD